MKHLILPISQLRTISILCGLLITISSVRAQALTDTSYNLLIGTYTQEGKSDGIYVYEFNSETGKSNYRAAAVGIKNPSFFDSF